MYCPRNKFNKWPIIKFSEICSYKIPMPTNIKISPPVTLAWTIWSLGALLYLIGFYQRVAPAVMTGELMSEFNIGATALGNLSAFYFYSYVAMQIPTGLLADNWGPRRLLTTGAFVAGTGSIIFALAPGILWASAGRLLIGGSVAVAWVGMLKLASQWFAPRLYSFVAGIALFCGIIGAVFAGVPLRLLINIYGWRPVMFFSAILALLLSIVIWVFVRDDPSDKGYKSYAPTAKPGNSTSSHILSGIVDVLRYPNTWLLFLIPGGIVGGVLTFGGLWGVPFFTTHHHMTDTEAAAAASALLVAWAVGGPIFGWLSDRIGRRKLPYIIGCTMAVIGWSLLIFINDISSPVLILLILLTGFASGCMIISFAFAKESVPSHLAGTVSGLINMGVMLGPTLLQPAVGWMLDRSWQGQTLDGIRIYSLDGYHTGFSLMIAWIMLTFFLLFFTRETHCKQIA